MVEVVERLNDVRRRRWFTTVINRPINRPRPMDQSINRPTNEPTNGPKCSTDQVVMTLNGRRRRPRTRAPPRRRGRSTWADRTAPRAWTWHVGPRLSWAWPSIFLKYFRTARVFVARLEARTPPRRIRALRARFSHRWVLNDITRARVEAPRKMRW